MKRPIRAIVYGFAIWWIWFGIVMLGALLPDDVTSAPSFASARLLVLVLLVVTATVDYLRRVERSSVGEGLIVGMTWGLLLVANDFGHFIYMEIVRGLPFDAGLYLGTFAPLYLFVPVMTATVMGGLAGRPAGSASLRSARRQSPVED